MIGNLDCRPILTMKKIIPQRDGIKNYFKGTRIFAFLIEKRYSFLTQHNNVNFGQKW